VGEVRHLGVVLEDGLAEEPLAQRHQVPVVCLSGGLGDGADEVLSRGIGAVASIVPQPMALEACISQGAELIEAGAARMCRLIRVGMGMH